MLFCIAPTNAKHCVVVHCSTLICFASPLLKIGLLRVTRRRMNKRRCVEYGVERTTSDGQLEIIFHFSIYLTCAVRSKSIIDGNASECEVCRICTE